eukprot:GHVS01035569.1.p1 GENE.GHVS01035569.1~~GHVS01035569.1.p1  ORF type:complete len:936 (+),score=75.25 GHVS01035569.1:213-3020(+)
MRNLPSVCVGVALGFLATVECKGEIGRPRLEARSGLEPSYMCPDGLKMEGTFCVETLVTEPKAICSTGFLDGGDCVHYYSATKECPPDYEMMGEKCVKFEEMVPTTSCREGYHLDGLRCSSKKNIEPQCPRGTVDLDGDKCAMYHGASKRCPPGFVASGGYHKGAGGSQCVKTNVEAPSETCTKGYSLADGGGSCELVKTVEPMCPHGSKDEGDKCAVHKAAELRCKPEYTLISGRKECTRIMIEKPQVLCAAGYVLNGNICEKSVPVPPVCSSGQKELLDGRCGVFHDAKPQCPETFGLSYAGGKRVCKKAVRVAAAVVCSEGYGVEDSNCVKTVKSPMVCPSGSSAAGEGCEVMSPASVKCAEGYQMTGSYPRKCFRTDRVEAKAACTKKFVLSDKPGICEKRKVCDPVYVCKTGARDGDKCVEYRNVAPSYTCPESFAMEGRRCMQKISKDCSVVEYKTECHDVPACYTKECEEKAAAERRLTGLVGRFRIAAPENKSSLCEKVAITHPKSCEKVLFADPRTECPIDSSPQGTGCRTASYHMPEPECPEGQFDETLNQCVKLRTKPAEYSCPDGYQKSVGDHRQCKKSVLDTVQHYCKEGSLKRSMCSNSVDKICEGGLCERKVAVLAEMQCPDGYHISTGQQEAGGSHGECVMDETAVATYVCAEGELVDGMKCAKYAPKVCPGGNCERVVRSGVKHSCLDGFKIETAAHSRRIFSSTPDESPKCVKSVSEPAEMVCSKELSVLVGSKCVKYVEKKCPGGQCQKVVHKPISYQCPEGYTEQRDYDAHGNRARLIQRHDSMKDKNQKYRSQAMQIKCVSRDFAEFELFCSKGEMSDNKRCAKYFNKACPDNRCEITLSARPEYHCVEGFTRRHGGLCEGSTYADPVYKCHKGAGNGKKCKKITPPMYTCPRGSSRSGGKCVAKRVQKPTMYF